MRFSQSEVVQNRTKEIIVALAGNPNVGKTTIFNALTGSHQHTGNWPGVTVEKKEGYFEHGEYTVKVIDLPGVYGLTAYSIDERIARDFLIHNRPDVVVVIVDSTNIERNLYLALELLEMGVNVVIDLNMIDDAKKGGIDIDSKGLSKYLKTPVVETVAVKKQGIAELREAIIEASKDESTSSVIKYPADFEEHIREIENVLKTHLPRFDYPLRWTAIKLLEQDAEIIEFVREELKDNWKDLSTELVRVITYLEKKYNDDISAIISQLRYAVVHGITKEFVKRKSTLNLKKRMVLTDRLDKIFTNRVLGIPIFLFLMWLTFQLTFSVGGIFADWIDSFFGWIADSIGNYLQNHGISNLVISLINDGIIGGVGTVLVFLPNIFLLFLAIAFLEDSGYMARAAFVVDKFMHAMGLHGKSFIPMILGFGCNVPAIMATRTIESEKDRIITVLINPLMSCSARLPIYTLFASAFFPKNQGLVIFSIYLIGIVLAVFMTKIFNVTFFKGETSLLIMELPPYRFPSLKNTFGEAGRRSSIFLKKAGTIIFIVVMILWLLASLPPGVEYASEDSIAGILGKAIAPIFKPAGFGFWQAGVALLFGTMAKEVVVGTFGALFGEATLADTLKNTFTPLSAYSFMLFSLIYTPCIATIAVIKRETGWKGAILSLIYLPLLAYIVSVGVYQVGMFFLR
ncbi:MAG: ferrous iron transport protein B [Thermotogae bacterium]|nr:ferrous iron transport protein B [Thermotogota bacterium]